MKNFSHLTEDLRRWFSKTDPEGGWKRINSKGEAIGPCAREPGEPKPKCMSNEKRAALSKKERAAAVRTKRKHDPNPERKGKPINVSNFGKGKLSEDMKQLDEKNVPTSPEKWAQAKAQAKAKFDVYPSAYANGWAAKKYKAMGGGWKSVSEAKDDREYDYEGEMVKSDLRSIIANANRLIDMLEDNTNLPEWVQSKVTVAEDYISTVANYMTAEMNETVSMQEQHREKGRFRPTVPYNVPNVKTPRPVNTPVQSEEYKTMSPSKNDVPFEGPYKKGSGTVTDKSGAKHSPYSRVRDLARKAMQKQMQKTVKESIAESRKSEIVKELVKKKKAEKFDPQPEIENSLIKTSQT